MRKYVVFGLMLVGLLLGACEKKLQPATVIVVDPVRHYYPVVQGETMGITYELENVSDNPLFIQEIQTTCGCLIPRDELPLIILPHKRGFVHLDFNTIKNNGYVEHFVDCYGNFKDTTMIQLQFDTNVVPQADYFRDYEQLWKEQEIDRGNLREFVDGTSATKGYFTDEGIDPRDQQIENMQRKVDEFAF